MGPGEVRLRGLIEEEIGDFLGATGFRYSGYLDGGRGLDTVVYTGPFKVAFYDSQWDVAVGCYVAKRSVKDRPGTGRWLSLGKFVRSGYNDAGFEVYDIAALANTFEQSYPQISRKLRNKWLIF